MRLSANETGLDTFSTVPESILVNNSSTATFDGFLSSTIGMTADDPNKGHYDPDTKTWAFDDVIVRGKGGTTLFNVFSYGSSKSHTEDDSHTDSHIQHSQLIVAFYGAASSTGQYTLYNPCWAGVTMFVASSLLTAADISRNGLSFQNVTDFGMNVLSLTLTIL